MELLVNVVVDLLCDSQRPLVLALLKLANILDVLAKSLPLVQKLSRRQLCRQRLPRIFAYLLRGEMRLQVLQGIVIPLKVVRLGIVDGLVHPVNRWLQVDSARIARSQLLDLAGEIIDRTLRLV